MQLNFLAFAVPLFIMLMAMEYCIARWRGKAFFNFANTAANIQVGIAERLCEAFVAGAFYYVYDYLHLHFALFNIPSNAITWIVLLLCTDFLWYWYHRFGHEINLFWSVHIVHHQSEDFNYTVSVRVTVFQAVARTLFWAVLPIIGFPAPMITVILLVHGLYPFFTHTRLVGKLGWLEYILVTPSHHRVHHASNEQYLDKNYGDVFIFWDKIFGTFAEEKEEPIYGLTHPLKSNSFLWQHFHYILELMVAMRREKEIQGKIKILFGRPDRVDPRIRPMLERKLNIQPHSDDAGNKLNRYVGWQIVFTLLTLFFYLLVFENVNLFFRVQVALLILTTLVNCGAILEQRQWIFSLEIARLLIFLSALAIYAPASLACFTIIAFCVLIILYFHSWEQKYLRLVYRQLHNDH